MISNKNIVKAIAFDFGGVIEITDRNLFQEIVEHLRVDIEEWKRIYFSFNHLRNVGEKTGKEVLGITAKEFGASDEQISHIHNLTLEIGKSKKINTDLLNLFTILRKQGLKIAIFSNNGKELRGRLDKNGILDLVDEAVISGEIGFQKPHKEAFEILFEKLGAKPHEVIFVDDTPKSLEKHAEIGYLPILFKNNQQLKEDLKKFGVFLE